METAREEAKKKSTGKREAKGMNISTDRFHRLIEIYEIAENVVEVVRSNGPPMMVAQRAGEEISTWVPHNRRFRVTAARVLRGPVWKYLANIEELIDLPIDGRKARVWRDVTTYFSTSSADSSTDCIDIALGFIENYTGRAIVFQNPEF
jgi:hypothetical protein